jgi:hypothetical protein
MHDLKGRRQAILVLAWFGVIFFVGWIAFTVAQAVYHGYGLAHGHVVAHQVGDQGGYGWFGDLAVLTGTGAACALIVSAWNWIGSRLPIDADPGLSPAEIDAQPFYVVDIPRITRALIVVGITCALGVTVCGAVLFPVILIKYGW